MSEFGQSTKSTRALPQTTELDNMLDDELAAVVGELDIDQQVPMLTDVLQVPRYQSDELPQKLDDVNWSALSDRVRDNVMERLMRKSTQMLEERMADTLQLVIDRNTANLNLELHDVLSAMIKEIVTKAVAEELNRVHTEISSRTS
jgi:hypothetical protein